MGRLTALLSNPVVLAINQTTAQYTSDSNACDERIGRVRLQEQPSGPPELTEYWPITTDEKDKKLATKPTECPAVVLTAGVLQFHPESNQLHVQTDCEAFKCLKTMSSHLANSCDGDYDFRSLHST